MKINTKIRVSNIINLALCLILVDYAGPFASYKGSIVLILLLGILMIAGEGLNKYSMEKKKLVSWKILFIYLILNSFLNLFSSLLYIAVFAVGFLIIHRYEDKFDFDFIFKFFKIVSVIIAVSVFVQAYLPNVFYIFAQKWFFYSNQYEQVKYLGQYCHQYSGLFYEVSFSAVILSIGIIIFLSELMAEKKNYFLNVFMTIAIYIAVILTGKRSFILILPVMVIVLYFIHNINRLNVTTLIISIIIIALLVWKFPDIYNVIKNILSKNSSKGIELSSREKFWSLAFNMFKENPIFGKGLNSFDIFFNASEIRSVQYEFAGAHNCYIQLLAETGLVGLIIYLTALLSTVIHGVTFILHNNSFEDKAILKYMSIAIGIIIIFLIYGISGNPLHQPQQLLTVCMCVSVVKNILNNLNGNSENMSC